MNLPCTERCIQEQESVLLAARLLLCRPPCGEQLRGSGKDSHIRQGGTNNKQNNKKQDSTAGGQRISSQSFQCTRRMIALYHQGIGMAEVKQTTKTERPQQCHSEICEPGINKSTMRKPRPPPARSLEITKCSRTGNILTDC